MSTAYIIVHGGAGRWSASHLQKAKQYLYAAAKKGKHYLTSLHKSNKIIEKNNGNTSDALKTAHISVKYLENSGFFNAGKGSINLEKDASIVDGFNQQAGSVIGVKSIDNPITVAKYVLEKTNHVILQGETPISSNQVKNDGLKKNVEIKNKKQKQKQKEEQKQKQKEEHETVGCIVVDFNGNIAAAASTGGISGSLPGRVGDVGIIGAGIFANKHCAALSTGIGEYFIRISACSKVCHLISDDHKNVQEATDLVIREINELDSTINDNNNNNIDNRGAIIAFTTNGEIGISISSNEIQLPVVVMKIKTVA